MSTIRYKRVCEQCGKTFKGRYKFQKFCNCNCAAKYKRLNPTTPEQLNKVCVTCGKPFTANSTRTRHCSKECCAIANAPEKIYIKKICKTCGIKFTTTKYLKRHCSTACHETRIKNQLHPANRSVKKAVEAGEIVKQKCHCGRKDVVAHHEDYSKPLDIVWLCHGCHSARHVEISEMELEEAQATA